MLEDRFRELRELEDGWDSYGANKPTKESIDEAENLIRNVFTPMGFPPPAMVPFASGGITLEWHNGDYEVALTIDENAKIESFYIFDGEDHELSV